MILSLHACWDTHRRASGVQWKGVVSNLQECRPSECALLVLVTTSSPSFEHTGSSLQSVARKSVRCSAAPLTLSCSKNAAGRPRARSVANFPAFSHSIVVIFDWRLFPQWDVTARYLAFHFIQYFLGSIILLLLSSKEVTHTTTTTTTTTSTTTTTVLLLLLQQQQQQLLLLLLLLQEYYY